MSLTLTTTGTASNNKRRKRVSLKPKSCPNPLFEKWLEELRTEASQNDSNMRFVYGKALQSLRMYPLPLMSGKECKILKNFGDSICNLLDKKLAKYREEGGIFPPPGSIPSEDEDAEPASKSSKPKRSKKSTSTACSKERLIKNPVRPYIPAKRSGAYAIIVTLYKQSLLPDYKDFTYVYISDQGQEVRDQDSALIRVDDDGFVGFLVKCDLELLKLTGKQYRHDTERISAQELVYLRDSDCDLLAPAFAHKSFSAVISSVCAASATSSFRRAESQTRITSATSTVSNSSASASLASASSTEQTFSLFPGEFEVVLCVDTAETCGGQGGGNGTQKDLTLCELQRQGVRYESRKLNLGDYVWICKSKTSTSHELVLPYVVERKRLDDLGSSIKDGRFKEQKFRLKSCGISVIYLVEDLHSRQQLGLPESTVLQAIANTHVVDGMNVKWTKDIRESVAYLNLMTKQMQKTYENRVLRNGESFVTFHEFNTQGVKNKPMTVTDLFAKQLLQINGVSADKARAIVDRYPTPSLLKAALDECNTNREKELLLSNIPFGKTKRMLGPALSKLLAWLYSRATLE
nr:EOG090X06E6 [Lepidurus arcticus]